MEGQLKGVTVLAVELRDITVENWEECIALSVSAAQRGMVAPNVYSIAQAKVQPECVPLAVYDGSTMVGFVMYALDRDDGNWWIYRLMIDERYQGKGYGRAALTSAIDRIRREPGCTKIVVSLKPNNAVARRLYRSLGFVETGQQVGGEDVMCLELGEK
jgi:Acetyltransferases